MSEDKIIRTLRYQAWERAKGEFNSMLATFWEDGSGSQFEDLDREINDFVERIESNGLHE